MYPLLSVPLASDSVDAEDNWKLVERKLYKVIVVTYKLLIFQSWDHVKLVCKDEIKFLNSDSILLDAVL